MVSDPENTSILLTQTVGGDSSAASRLMPLVYEELRKVAAGYFRRFSPGNTLEPTALVNEAYLRMVDQSGVDWKSRAHFMAIAATQMHRILVDHARRRGAAKRGGSWRRVTLAEAVQNPKGGEVDILDLNDALGKLRELDPRASQVVHYRFFGGMKIDEVAHVLGVSPRTVRDDWHMARAWLSKVLSNETQP